MLALTVVRVWLCRQASSTDAMEVRDWSDREERWPGLALSPQCVSLSSDSDQLLSLRTVAP